MGLWRYFIINGKEFYAPDIAVAFDLARRHFGNKDLKWEGVRFHA